jgi:hypothetical protein
VLSRQVRFTNELDEGKEALPGIIVLEGVQGPTRIGWWLGGGGEGGGAIQMKFGGGSMGRATVGTMGGVRIVDEVDPRRVGRGLGGRQTW